MATLFAGGSSPMDGHLIGYVLHEPANKEQQRIDEANARLIAAAPELLNACKAVLAALENADLQGAVLWIEPPYQAPAVHESAQERLQAVIEKATGESE